MPGLDILDLTSELGPQFEKTPMVPIIPRFDTVQIGTTLFEDIGAMAMRTSSSNAIASVLEDGLIGANRMQNFIWQIDFQAHKIHLTDRIESCVG